jgi:hypothetical protein
MSDQADVDRDAIVLPEFEARFEAAKSRGASDEEMQSLSEEYQQARQDEYNNRNPSDEPDTDTSSTGDEEVLRGQALDDRIDELGIEGTSSMSADEKRQAVADAESADNTPGQNDPNASPAQTGI